MTLQIYSDNKLIHELNEFENFDEICGIMAFGFTTNLKLKFIYNNEEFSYCNQLPHFKVNNIRSNNLNKYNFESMSEMYGVFMLNVITDVEPLFTVYHFQDPWFIEGIIKCSELFNLDYKDFMYHPYFDKYGRLYVKGDINDFYFRSLWPRKQPSMFILADDLYRSKQITKSDHINNYISIESYSSMFEPILQNYYDFEPLKQKNILKYDNDPINNEPYYYEEGTDDDQSFVNTADSAF